MDSKCNARYYEEIEASPMLQFYLFGTLRLPTQPEVKRYQITFAMKYTPELTIRRLNSAFRFIVDDRTNPTLLAAAYSPDNRPPHALRLGFDALSPAQWSDRALRK